MLLRESFSNSFAIVMMMQSGLMYFKNWNTGTLTYRDPRPHSLSAHHPPTSHRIGLLSISLHPHDTSLLPSVMMSNDLTHQLFPRQSGTTLTHSSAKRKSEHSSPQENCRSAMTIGDHHDDDDHHHHHHCLELSLNPPGSSSMSTSTQQQDDSTSSVCTVEKVRSALERSQWSGAAPSLLKKSRLITCGSSSTSGMDYYATSSEISITPLSMNVQPVGLPQPTSSRESITSSLRARLVQSDLEYSKPNSPSLISQCISSECFTASSSAMSYEGREIITLTNWQNRFLSKTYTGLEFCLQLEVYRCSVPPCLLIARSIYKPWEGHLGIFFNKALM